MEVIKGRSIAVAATTKTMSSSSIHQQSQSSTSSDQEDNMDLRRGPWTVEEDFKLMNYIANHGEGRWNSLARCAGLKRTGKSCRLRWLNYLRPDVRRGNITLEEQLLILELHSRWGNRWSKIAQHLPGRTDNEIKNYWRTRVQKHAKQLKCDVNSKQFKDAMRYLWMPRLMERIQAANATATSSSVVSAAATHSSVLTTENNNIDLISSTGHMGQLVIPPMGNMGNNEFCCGGPQDYYTPENSISTAASSDSFGTQVSPVSDLTDYYNIPVNNNPNPDYNNFQPCGGQVNPDYNTLISPSGYYTPGLDFMDQSNQLMDGGDVSTDNLWNVEDIWFLQQQFNNDNNM